jgi:hypothetical protein
MVSYRGNQPRRGGRGNDGRANMTRGFDNDDYRPYDEHIHREYHYDYYNPQHSRTHFFCPHNPSLVPIITMDALAIVVYIPELGTFGGCEQTHRDMAYQS